MYLLHPKKIPQRVRHTQSKILNSLEFLKNQNGMHFRDPSTIPNTQILPVNYHLAILLPSLSLYFKNLATKQV